MNILNAVVWGVAILVVGIAAHSYLEKSLPRGSRLLALAVTAVVGGIVIWCVAPRPEAATLVPAAEPTPCPCVERFRPGSRDCSGAVEWMPAEAREDQ